MSFNTHQHSETNSQERHDLYQENKRIKKQLRELLDSVASYRGTQHKFEHFELQLLQCQNFNELIGCLIEILPVEFKLDKISLTLFDPDKIAREMLGWNAYGNAKSICSTSRCYSRCVCHDEEYDEKEGCCIH